MNFFEYLLNPSKRIRKLLKNNNEDIEIINKKIAKLKSQKITNTNKYVTHSSVFLKIFFLIIISLLSGFVFFHYFSNVTKKVALNKDEIEERKILIDNRNLKYEELRNEQNQSRKSR